MGPALDLFWALCAINMMLRKLSALKIVEEDKDIGTWTGSSAGPSEAGKMEDGARVTPGRYFFAQGTVKYVHSNLVLLSFQMPHHPSERTHPWPFGRSSYFCALQRAQEHAFVDKTALTKTVMLFTIGSTSALHYDTIRTTQVQVTGSFSLSRRELAPLGFIIV